MRSRSATVMKQLRSALVTPYQKAVQVWDQRIGSARVQAKN